jgi:phosphatidate cytidylyltransferase
MLGQRILTAVLLLLVVLGALAWSPLAFGVVVAAVIATALWEWLRLTGLPSRAAAACAAALGVVLVVVQALGWSASPGVLLGACALATTLWLLVAARVAGARHTGFRFPAAVDRGLALIAVLAAWLAVRHFLVEGPVFLLSVLAIVWVADIAAYFCGRAFGRTKLAPAISPGKTWAGVWGAIVLVLVIAESLALAAPQWPLYTTRLIAGVTPLVALSLLGALVLLSVAGDLYESQLKRNAGTKDSSHLLPGHGGFYDRIDALVPVLPAAVLIERLFA